MFCSREFNLPAGAKRHFSTITVFWKQKECFDCTSVPSRGTGQGLKSGDQISFLSTTQTFQDRRENVQHLEISDTLQTALSHNIVAFWFHGLQPYLQMHANHVEKRAGSWSIQIPRRTTLQTLNGTTLHYHWMNSDIITRFYDLGSVFLF